MCIYQSQKSKRTHKCYVYDRWYKKLYWRIIMCWCLKQFLVSVVCPQSVKCFRESIDTMVYQSCLKYGEKKLDNARAFHDDRVKWSLYQSPWDFYLFLARKYIFLQGLLQTSRICCDKNDHPKSWWSGCGCLVCLNWLLKAEFIATPYVKTSFEYDLLPENPVVNSSILCCCTWFVDFPTNPHTAGHGCPFSGRVNTYLIPLFLILASAIW